MGTTTIKRAIIGTVGALGLLGGSSLAVAETVANRVTGTGTPATFGALPFSACGNLTTRCRIIVTADEGLVAAADAGTSADVPIWGFSLTGGSGQLAGPATAIKVRAGQQVEIVLANKLDPSAGPVELSFPSVPANSINRASVTISGTSYPAYRFRANTVGTSVYQAGLSNSFINPAATDLVPRQVAMGLVGAFIVDDGSASYNDEALIATADLDTEFAANPLTFDMSYYAESKGLDSSINRSVRHLINGKVFPKTDVIDVHAGDTVLVRHLNASNKDKSMGILGLHQTLLSRNANAYKDSQELVAPLVGPGETADVRVSIPASGPTRYAFSEQGRRMGNYTGAGFGGAMTFLNVWPAAPVAAVAAVAAAVEVAPLPAITGPTVDTAVSQFSAEVTAAATDATIATIDYAVTDPAVTDPSTITSWTALDITLPSVTVNGATVTVAGYPLPDGTLVTDNTFWVRATDSLGGVTVAATTI
jgi:FtsP/CotA-like multicopper oxidase with cupredoxin domain